MSNSPIIGQLIEQQDDFTFDHDDFIYTVYQSEYDKVDMGDLEEDVFHDRYPEPVTREEVTTYYADDKVGPDYVRRFEDTIPTENMEKFIRHVLSNALTNDKAFKSYQKEHPVGERRKLDDGDEDDDVIENELQEERAGSEVFSDSMILSARRDLAYCLYRMNRMSRRCGVNMLSVVLAQRRSRPYMAKSTRVEKPQALLRNGPIYYADANGDCTAEITVATDRAFAKARNIFYADGGDGTWLEFVDDYKKLEQCFSILEIDARSDDPRRYTSTFIKRVSSKILVDNFSYVARANGGYNKEILNKLRTMSLDLVQNVSVEREINPIAIALNIIMDYELTPSTVHRAFTKTPPNSSVETCYKVLPLLQRPDVCQTISNVIGTGALSGDGFLLDDSGDYFRLRCKNFINVSRWGNVATGNFYIHYSGYVVFEPVNDKLVILSKLEDMLEVYASDDWTNLAVIPLGERAGVIT